MTTLIKTNGNGRNLFFPEFPALFDDFFTKDFVRSASKPDAIPAVNIKESENTFDLELAAPGMDKSNFKIELKSNILKVSAVDETRSEEKSEDNKYIRKEFSYRTFTRSFSLPKEGVNENNISASYTDGILNISIPKKEKEKENGVKEISIS